MKYDNMMQLSDSLKISAILGSFRIKFSDMKGGRMNQSEWIFWPHPLAIQIHCGDILDQGDHDSPASEVGDLPNVASSVFCEGGDIHGKGLHISGIFGGVQDGLFIHDIDAIKYY